MWTKEETEYLIQNEKIKSPQGIADHLGKDKKVVLAKGKRLGLNLANKFEQWEIDIIKNNLDKTNKEISDLFLPHRTPDAIRHVCEKNHWLKIRGRQWVQEEINNFIALYPHKSFVELKDIFTNLTKAECQWMRDKYKLKKSENRSKQRYIENSQLAPLSWSEEKELLLISLYNETNNVKKTINLYQKQFAGNKFYLTNKMISLGLIPKDNIFLYKRMSAIDKEINLNDAFKYYKIMLSGKSKRGRSFSKEQTIFLFKYWMKVNSLKREILIKNDGLRKIFDSSLLSASIRSNFKHHYEFVMCLFDKPNDSIYPWDIGKQLPPYYFDNKHNVFWMIAIGIKRLLNDLVIQDILDVLLLSKNALSTYFNSSVIHKTKIMDYFDFCKIDYQSKNYKVYNNILFDSFEELNVFRYINSLGFNINKCNKKFKLYNPKHLESYIPDFIMYHGGSKVIIEYFGLYSDKVSLFEYKEKTHRKIEFYNDNNYYFIDLYPDDLNNNFVGVFNKIYDYFLNNFGCDVRAVTK